MFISAALFLGAAFILAGCAQQPAVTEKGPVETGKATQSEVQAPTREAGPVDAGMMAELGLQLEEDFGLDEVLASLDGATLLVKFRAPTISGEELNEGLVQIFGYLAAQAPAGADKIRLVFVINHEYAVVEVTLQQVKDWMAGKIDNADFISSFKKLSLIK